MPLSIRRDVDGIAELRGDFSNAARFASAPRMKD